MHTCSKNFDDPIEDQVEICKLQIFRNECENKSIDVWSNTKTINNTLNADEIKTTSSCISSDITINYIIATDTTIGISYSVNNKSNQVKEISMVEWNAISPTIATTHSVKATNVNRSDSTKLTDVTLHFRVDSQKLKQTIKKIEDKTQRIIDIIQE